MMPVEFEHQNCIFAKDQPQYIPLPAYRAQDGRVTSCWTFTWLERLRILFGARLFWTQHTFNQSLQPVRPSLDFEV